MNRLVGRFELSFPSFYFNVSLDLPAEGITAVFGPSGSGKTTLLRCLAGLDRAHGGLMRLGEEVWQDEAKSVFVPLYDRSIGYVFQEPRLFPHYNVRSNLLYGYKRTAPAQRRVSFEQVTNILGIEHLLTRRPSKLSGGEQQRVAIGRALLTSPKLLLLDEPLASLDIQRKQEILPFIQRFHRELQIPVIYVSHAVSEILQLADRIVLLNQGMLVAAGPLNDVFSSLNLRGRMGSIQVGAVLDTQVASHEPDYGLSRVEFKGQFLYVPLQPRSVGECLRIHILASDVSLATERVTTPTSVLNVLEATVMEIREVDQSLVDVRLDIGAPLVASITRKSAANLGLKVGQRVYAHVKALALNEELTE